MTLAPKSERRISYVIMGMLAFGATFSYAYTMQEQYQRVNGVPIDIWPWITTALFLIVVILIAIGLLVMKREFSTMGSRMDRVQENIEKLWGVVDRNSNRITRMEVLCGTRHTEE